jgi:hypothetical protein
MSLRHHGIVLTAPLVFWCRLDDLSIFDQEFGQENEEMQECWMVPLRKVYIFTLVFSKLAKC